MTLANLHTNDIAPAGPLGQFWSRLAQWAADMFGSDAVPVDPMASFTPHEWADIPAWHPREDDTPVHNGRDLGY